MKVGALVYVTLPWPSGPSSEVARITSIDKNQVKLTVDLGSGWKVGIVAPRSRIALSPVTNMLHLEQDIQEVKTKKGKNNDISKIDRTA